MKIGFDNIANKIQASFSQRRIASKFEYSLKICRGLTGRIHSADGIHPIALDKFNMSVSIYSILAGSLLVTRSRTHTPSLITRKVI